MEAHNGTWFLGIDHSIRWKWIPLMVRRSIDESIQFRDTHAEPIGNWNESRSGIVLFNSTIARQFRMIDCFSWRIGADGQPYDGRCLVLTIWDKATTLEYVRGVRVTRPSSSFMLRFHWQRKWNSIRNYFLYWLAIGKCYLRITANRSSAQPILFMLFESNFECGIAQNNINNLFVLTHRGMGAMELIKSHELCNEISNCLKFTLCQCVMCKHRMAAA